VVEILPAAFHIASSFFIRRNTAGSLHIQRLLSFYSVFELAAVSAPACINGHSDLVSEKPGTPGVVGCWFGGDAIVRLVQLSC
jgi:hypothetical protein